MRIRSYGDGVKMAKTGGSSLRRGGRPKIEGEEVVFRLKTDLAGPLAKAASANGRTMSEEIRNRLAGSFAQPNTDEETARVGRALEFIGRLVSEGFGVAWHQDAKAHAALVEAINLYLKTELKPEKTTSHVTLDPADAAHFIVNQYRAQSQSQTDFRPTIREQLSTPEEKLSRAQPIQIDGNQGKGKQK